MLHKAYFALLALTLGLLASCVPVTAPGSADDGTVTDSGGDNAPSTQPPPASAEALPDFKVIDVNAASPRFGQAVSPRDYLGEVSAWYFGQST